MNNFLFVGIVGDLPLNALALAQVTDDSEVDGLKHQFFDSVLPAKDKKFFVQDFVKDLDCVFLAIDYKQKGLKKKLREEVENLGLPCPPLASRGRGLIDPLSYLGDAAWVAPTVRIQMGCEVMEGSFIGEGSILLHSCSIGEYSWIESNATLCERSKIGKNCFIGDSVTLAKNVKVGDNSIVCGGAFLTEDVPPNSVAMYGKNKINENANVDLYWGRIG